MKQEIESAGGEVAVFQAASVEGATDDEIIAAFRNARDAEFKWLTAEFDGPTGRIKEQARAKHLSPGRLAVLEADIDKLHVELKRVIANDFFGAKPRSQAEKSYERCQAAIRLSQAPNAKRGIKRSSPTALSLQDYQGRRWVTRRNIHIDRVAPAWLIKQFIDKRPRFYFVADGETVDNAIRFDMVDGEFTHHGDDCTFETIVKRFNLGQINGLRELAQVVHDIDLKDDKYHRLEAVGLNAIINRLSEALRNDRKLLQHASVIFDALFITLNQEPNHDRQIKKRKPSRSK